MLITYVTTTNLAAKTDEWMRGVRPFNTHEWSPVKEFSALIVIDCQNFFVADPEPDGAPILPTIRKLIDLFRELERPIIFTRHMHRPDLSDAGMTGEWWEDNIIENTPESELHPSLGATADDIVIRKNRYNAFHGTTLEDYLRMNDITDLIITGVMTNLCCESTAREAFMRDYRVFFPADATGTACEEMHFASLINIAYGFGVIMRAEEIITALT